jgi:peptidyl-prolyl cis-trans isomerase D
VEVAPGILVAAHLLEHQPAALVPLAEVKSAISTELTQKKAQALAVEKGTAALAGDKTQINWGKAQSVARMNPGTLPYESLSAVFRTDAKKLPGYVGVELPGVGYALYKVNKVTAGELPDELVQALGEQLASIGANAQVSAYRAALRQRYKVDINRKQLEDNKD